MCVYKTSGKEHCLIIFAILSALGLKDTSMYVINTQQDIYAPQALKHQLIIDTKDLFRLLKRGGKSPI